MSDTVKVVIEIYEDTYKYCLLTKDEDKDDLGFFTSHILEAVANGTPLDSVKAEIAKPIQEECCYIGEAKIQADTIKWCLDILDNIGKAESEG